MINSREPVWLLVIKTLLIQQRL